MAASADHRLIERLHMRLGPPGRGLTDDEQLMTEAVDAIARLMGEREEFAPRCTNHPDRPSRTNLDGDELCQECATAWVKGEGEHAAWLQAQDAEAESAR